jgi:hypothetical protein
MSLEGQIRRALERGAGVPPPELEDPLRVVIERGRRRRAFRRASGGAAILVAVVLSLVTGPEVLRQLRPTTPAGQPGPFAEVAGTYSATLSASDPDVAQASADGNWVMTLDEIGDVTLDPPPGFPEGMSGISFQVLGDRLRIDAFIDASCSGLLPGEYRWRLVDRDLVLDPIDEPCALRAAVLSARWERQT